LFLLTRTVIVKLAAESIFCCQFSATSQSSSNRGQTQEGRDFRGICLWSGWKQANGSSALHVSFAHITPSKSVEAWAKLSRHCVRVAFRTGWLARTFGEGTDLLSLSTDGHLVLSANNKIMRLWEVSTGRCLSTFGGNTGRITAVCLSTDGRFALSGSSDQSMRLWEATTGHCLRVFRGHARPVTSVSLSDDGLWALSGSGGNWYTPDNTVRLWEVATGHCLRIFRGHTGPVTSVSLSGDGRWALSGSGAYSYTADKTGLVSDKTVRYISDNTVRLWDIASGGCLRIFRGHATDKVELKSFFGTGLIMPDVTSVSLSADGRLALSGSRDRTMRLWEVANGSCLHTLQGRTDSVTAVGLSADGRFALSGSRDRTMRLWEVATGHCAYTFQEYTSPVTAVCLSADGRFALSGSRDHIQLWKLDWELEAHDLADWENGALPYLEMFLTQHTPYAGVLSKWRKPFPWEIQRALMRCGKPTWNEQDFQNLIWQLQYAGYGWLRPEGVRRKLEGMAASWQVLPPFSG
jgi:WD40 repeat protein